MHLRGVVTGVEARAFNNLNVNRIYGNPVDLLAFGPDINLIVDPRNGRNGENPSEDGTLAGIYAAQYEVPRLTFFLNPFLTVLESSCWRFRLGTCACVCQIVVEKDNASCRS